MDERQPVIAPEVLDAYWDALLDGAPPPAAADLEPSLGATVTALHRLPGAPGPSASFVARLEDEMLGSPVARARPVSIAPPLPAPPPARRWFSSPQPATEHPAPRPLWRRATEIAAVAVLLAAIAAGTLLGTGPLSGGDDVGGDRTAVPAPMVALETHAGGTPTAEPPSGSAMYLGNAARTGEVAGSGPRAEPSLAWSVDLGGELENVTAVPIAAGGMVYVATTETRIGADPDEATAFVAAYEGATGRERWRTQVALTAIDGSLQISTPALADGLLVLGITTFEEEDDSSLAVSSPNPLEGAVPESAPDFPAAIAMIEVGAIVALDARTGAERWRLAGVGSAFSPPAIVDGVVYAPSDDGGIAALDAATGAERWRRAAGTWSDNALAVADGLVYAAGDQLRAFDAATRRLRWHVDSGDRLLGSPVVADGTLYFTAYAYRDETDGDSSSRLYALDAATGTERWSTEIGEQNWPPPVVGDGLVLLTGLGDDGSLTLALDAATGEERWRFTTEGWTTDPPVLADGVLYVHGYDPGLFALDFSLLGAGSTLYALDLQSGATLWTIGLDLSSSLNPAVADSRLFLIHAPGHGGEGITLHAYAER